jgi:hypothetical protein
MDLLCINFHYDRLFERYEHIYTIETLLTLLLRARKLYTAIDCLSTIFKLNGKREQANDPSVRARLLVAIKTFLSEHTLFPVQFKFGGEDLL